MSNFEFVIFEFDIKWLLLELERLLHYDVESATVVERTVSSTFRIPKFVRGWGRQVEPRQIKTNIFETKSAMKSANYYLLFIHVKCIVFSNFFILCSLFNFYVNYHQGAKVWHVS